MLYENGKHLDIVVTPAALTGNIYAVVIVGLTALVVVWCEAKRFSFRFDIDTNNEFDAKQT